MTVRWRLVFRHWVEVILTVLVAAGVVYTLDVVLRPVFVKINYALGAPTTLLLVGLSVVTCFVSFIASDRWRGIWRSWRTVGCHCGTVGKVLLGIVACHP